MTHDKAPTPTAADDLDEQAELLAAYQAGLELGRPPASLHAEHPELSDAFRCLEALRDFARATESRTPAVLAADATLPCDAASAAEPPAQSGEFGPYELLAELGRGGMGVVFKARHKSLNRVVALKLILARHWASETQRRRFAAEAQASARLRHEHIVRLLDSGHVQGQPFLAMDFIDGPSLAQVVASGPMPPDQAAKLVRQVALAVEYLHRQGVVHRDLKPSNILLDEHGQPYVVDFGLAKLLASEDRLTASGQAAGTPSYMAPEQALGHASASAPLCDVYSLGAVLYELLTGRPPFQAASAVDALLQVLEREPAAPRQVNPSVPQSLSLICLRCLEKAPGRRYPSAAAMADDLERYLCGEPIAARAGGPWQRIRRWGRRQPALAAHLAAFTLFYGVELTNYLLGRWDASFHNAVSLVLLVWVGVCVGCQRFMARPRGQAIGPWVWSIADAFLLFALLLLANGAASPLVVAYSLLIVGAGLWFRESLVWFTTAAAVASYSMMVADYYFRRSDLREHSPLSPDHHLFLLFAMVVIGAAVAYQVRRVRSLSRYYEHRGPN